MTRQEKADIARRNGAKSKGPKTAAGKSTVSRNALKHGRYASRALESAASRAVATYEDKEHFIRLVRRNLAELQPKTAAERDVALALADTQFRYERWNAVETSLLDAEHRAVLNFYAGLREAKHMPEAEFHARAARRLATGGAFLQRITAERSRLIRERAAHLRYLKFLRKELDPAPEQTKVQTKEQTKVQTNEQTNVLPFRRTASR